MDDGRRGCGNQSGQHRMRDENYTPDPDNIRPTNNRKMLPTNKHGPDNIRPTNNHKILPTNKHDRIT